MRLQDGAVLTQTLLVIWGQLVAKVAGAVEGPCSIDTLVLAAMSLLSTQVLA